MSLLTEQEIKDVLIPVFMKQDQPSIHWPDIFEEVAAIESAVIAKIKAQGPVVEVSRGIGWVDCDVVWQNEPPPDGTKLYRLPEGD